MEKLYRVFDNRTTDDAVVVTNEYRYGWITYTLYDSRTTPYDVPLELLDSPVVSVTIENDVTIIEI